MRVLACETLVLCISEMIATKGYETPIATMHRKPLAFALPVFGCGSSGAGFLFTKCPV